MFGFNKKEIPFVICWDLDETLGDFRALEKGSDAVKIREGMQGVLEAARQKGIRQVVTTSATRDYAEKGLGILGIREYFDEIFPFEKVAGYLGKKYKPVLEHYKLTEKEAGEKLIVVGDSIRDRPLDISGLTALIECDTAANAENIGHAIAKLTSNGSLKTSYNKLFAEARQTPEGYKVIEKVFKGECALTQGKYDNDGKEIELNLIMFLKKTKE